MRCKANKADGRQCGARAVCGSEYCFRHNPDTKKEALQASSRGGLAKRQYTTLGRPMKLETPQDIKRLMEKAINKLWIGEMPASNPAGSLGYLAKIFLESCEKGELENRVEQLQKRLESLGV